MKLKSITRATVLIPQIIEAKDMAFPVVHLRELQAVKNRIEHLEQDYEDLPEGKAKEYCKKLLRECYSALQSNVIYYAH